MEPNQFKLIELGMLFGGLLLFLSWEWYKVRKSLREDDERERDAERKAKPGP
mgnify:CR=1 FL=1|jgi:hypothetical protein